MPAMHPSPEEVTSISLGTHTANPPQPTRASGPHAINPNADTPVPSALALSWPTSSYWLFVLVFHSLCFLFALSYAAKTIRHLRSRPSA